MSTEEAVIPRSGSLFVDSGAHGLYTRNVLKSQAARVGAHGRELEKPSVAWAQGDFSYYDLRPGQPFRKFCDSWASFYKKFIDRGVLMPNVDVISHPELTWQVQQFFEKEHGIRPIPVVHFGTPMKYVDRYLEAGYDMLGVGGIGQNVRKDQYLHWGDQLFVHICPESNKYLPLVKCHGFAMTSWSLLCRYPWWSCDSVSWMRYAAYGWLCFPRWTDGVGWRYDKDPWRINISAKSPRKTERQKHFDNVPKNIREDMLRWLAKWKVPVGTVDDKNEMVEYGAISHFRARATLNLHYFIDLQESRPKWPHPLDLRKVCRDSVTHVKGFGL